MGQQLPKREARQQILELTLAAIWVVVIDVASAFIGPRFFYTTNYNRRNFSLLLVAIFVVPVYFVVMWRMKRRAARVEFRREKSLCINCGYDLRGNVSGACPECGEQVENSN